MINKSYREPSDSNALKIKEITLRVYEKTAAFTSYSCILYNHQLLWYQPQLLDLIFFVPKSLRS